MPNLSQQRSGSPSTKSVWARFAGWMREHIAFDWETNLLGIKLSARTWIGKLLVTGVALIVLFGSSLVVWWWLSGQPDIGPIQVFLPDRQYNRVNAFYQDGGVQMRGFEQAVRDAQAIPNRLEVNYNGIKSEETADSLLQRIKELYAKDHSTYFVMTMSSKVLGVRRGFMAWYRDCVAQKMRAPVLIATVASAPQIPNASSGLLRWYVRSDEESSVLAAYLRWNRGVSRVGVFYIEKKSGQPDPYGKHGMEVFRERFFALGGSKVEEYNTKTETAKTRVEEFMAKQAGDSRGAPGSGAFVVGYGDMVRDTMGELIIQGFGGPIACTSTLTEPDWQPSNAAADERIFTVLPRLKDRQEKLKHDNRNVVYFFARKTLQRVLELTVDRPGAIQFIERWKDGQGTGEPELVQEHLANGDVSVRLDVVGADDWR